MRLCIVFFTTLLVGSSAHAGNKSHMMTAYAEEFGTVAAKQFCELVPVECEKNRSPHRMTLTPERLVELDTINRDVNLGIKAESDCALYLRADVWAIPTTHGNCEDYTLRKRQLLRERGWPISALLITFVLTEAQEGHAVLTVLTDGGDFILDNLSGTPRLWHETNYIFVRRQSTRDPRKWRGLIPKQEVATRKKVDEWTSCAKGCQECRPPW